MDTTGPLSSWRPAQYRKVLPEVPCGAPATPSGQKAVGGRSLGDQRHESIAMAKATKGLRVSSTSTAQPSNVRPRCTP